MQVRDVDVIQIKRQETLHIIDRNPEIKSEGDLNFKLQK